MTTQQLEKVRAAGESGAGSLPRDFGKYRLLRRIGMGGMAEVYLARPRGQRRLVAIKCMRDTLAGRPTFVEMFVREGKLSLELNHDVIVKTFEIGSVDGVPFICMEYISGIDLAQLIPRIQSHHLQRLPVPHAVYIAAQVCEGLHHAHELKDADGHALRLVNRDVNPSNIRLSFDGKVKLLDFGIAKAATALSSEIGAIKGKIGHMSPEQVRGLPLDRRSDIFAVGVTLHEILTGERLFRGSSDFQTMDRVRHAEVTPPSRGNSRVPPELDVVVLRMLQRNPEDRYQTADVVAADLYQVLARYRFVPTELRDLLRELFRDEWQGEQQAIDALKVRVTAEQNIVDHKGDYGEFVEVISEAHVPPRQKTRRSAAVAPWWILGLLGLTVALFALAGFLVLRR